ncbi:MAG: hypothetical protein WAM71_06940 [Candidatus Korobacteraceae bacterium]
MTNQQQTTRIDPMGPTAIFAFMAIPLLTKFGSALMLSNALRHSFMVSFMSGFALQLDDLDSGLGNELWFVAIVVVVAAGVYFVYRGPRET